MPQAHIHTIVLALFLAAGVCGCASRQEPGLPLEQRALNDAIAAAERGDFYYFAPTPHGATQFDADGIPIRSVGDAISRQQLEYIRHYNQSMKRLIEIGDRRSEQRMTPTATMGPRSDAVTTPNDQERPGTTRNTR